jgi:hypothetical protein
MTYFSYATEIALKVTDRPAMDDSECLRCNVETTLGD